MLYSEEFKWRLKQKGWTLYRLAKEICHLRSQGESNLPVTRYHSAIGKAIDNPASSRLETLQDIVRALDGEIVIVWNIPRVPTK